LSQTNDVRVYLVDDDWTLEEVTTVFQYGQPEFYSAPPNGGAWHVMDFGYAVFFFNGSCMLWTSPQAEGKWYSTETPVIGTGCNADGRGVWGNISGWTDDWKLKWGEVVTRIPSGAPGLDSLLELGTNVVAWGTIGGGDLLWWVDPDLADTGTQQFLKRWKTGQIGAMPMPWPGAVLALRPLGRAVIVYGDTGIGALVPDGHSYGYKHLASVGIPSRGLVTGDDRGHFCVDNVASMLVVQPDLTIKELRYRRWLGELFEDQAHVPVMSFDAEEREVWISNPDATYVINQYGLAKAPQLVSSVAAFGGHRWGIAEDFDDQGFAVETEVLDFGTRSPKTVYEAQLSCSNPERLSFEFDYRSTVSDDFATAGPFVPNRDGMVTLAVSFVECRIRVLGDDYTEQDLDRIELLVGVGGKLVKKNILEA
jgi:hypothetical protein